MTDEQLPEPLVPAEVDLRDFPSMFLDVRRLLTSTTWIRAKKDPRLGHAAVSLWAESWHQVPAASLPDDDEVLMDLARCDEREWKRVRERVMQGWVRCSDGRLYHAVVAEKALEAWQRKVSQRAKTKNATEARLRRARERDEQRHVPRDVERDEARDVGRDVHQGREKGEGERDKPSPAARSTAPTEGAREGDRPPGRTAGGGLIRPPPDAAAAQAQATESERIAEALRQLGMVAVTSRIEAVAEMAELRPSAEQLQAAVERARTQRARDDDPTPINAGFVLAKLRRVLEGVGEDEAAGRPRVAEPPGWRSAAKAGDFRKADELARTLAIGTARPGEDGPAYLARIDAALERATRRTTP